ncbi:MAG: saccharopine dehydrogenase NADP-binding domain-containing protein [Methanomassiliicoccales archaeon]|nr:MAG: saccharopine dehydrogenase NADP-binding domain-containing protein [Methanomassiliicoccales archaeon]
MSMWKWIELSYRYAVLGAGRQGIAAAYDLAKFGDAKEIILVDVDGKATFASADRVNKLFNQQVAIPKQVDVKDAEQLISILEGIKTVISAVPFGLNLGITEVAVRVGSNMCDLGGATHVAKKQLEYDEKAKAAGITIVPDCGMGPGMNISLALYAMSLLDEAREVYIWDGGLPLQPKPPWNYALTFNMCGLTNEYFGKAFFLRDGRIIEVPCFEDYEELDFPPPLNKLEAFVTSGGLSTMPWTFLGKLQRLENKTLRYPGHWAQFKAFSLLGLLETEPIKIGDVDVSPRDVLSALLEPKLTQSDVKDVGIIRIKCVGRKDGRPAEAIVELIDHYDEDTGFTAMQRLTGWHASIVAILSAQNRIRKGVVPVETIPGEIIVKEALRRGFSIEERTNISE